MPLFIIQKFAQHFNVPDHSTNNDTEQLLAGIREKSAEGFELLNEYVIAKEGLQILNSNEYMKKNHAQAWQDDHTRLTEELSAVEKKVFAFADKNNIQL